jgi:DNA-binding CsgD family transcriptional regulator
MKQRKRIYCSAAQRSEIWDRWRRGESMSSIGRRFDRESSSVFSVLSPSGGIRPAERRRSARSLSLAEREEVSRGLVAGRSLRAIASQLGRAPSTISREIGRNGGRDRYRATGSDQAAWERALCRADAAAICTLLADVSGTAPVLWGNIVGFGSYHYTYTSGRSGTAPRLGFSPRKAQHVLYLMDGFDGQADLLARLGKAPVTNMLYF